MSQPLENNSGSSVSGSMVALLPLLLIPVVISGFLLVYALVGLVLEGDSLARWVTEAWSVTWPTGLAQLFFCATVLFFVKCKKLPRSHILYWSSLAHIGLVMALVAMVYFLFFAGK